MDKLLNRIGGIDADIDGVTDEDVDLSRLQGKAFLGHDAPASIDRNPHYRTAAINRMKKIC